MTTRRQSNASEPTRAAAERPSSWIPTASTSRVGIDPACWTSRVRQVALWRAMDGWCRQRRSH